MVLISNFRPHLRDMTHQTEQALAGPKVACFRVVELFMTQVVEISESLVCCLILYGIVSRRDLCRFLVLFRFMYDGM